MPLQRRAGLLPQRRRHDDDPEEDASAGAPEYASTTGSLTTDPGDDGDASAGSAGEDTKHSSAPSPQAARSSNQPSYHQAFKTTADTEAMLRGLKIKADDEDVEVLQYGHSPPTDAILDGQSTVPEPAARTKSQPTATSKQTSNHHTQSHDRRGDVQPRTQFRGRGRGFGFGLGGGRGNNFGSFPTDTNKQWTHDLHETVSQPAPPQERQQTLQSPLTTPTGPNRTFSTTTVLGNVPVNVVLPGTEPRAAKSIVKKHYTLLPQHRPPLRRDKPVRISIPDEHPRYIFPNADRSFIFIPRAMRPNQQARGRGRGSFHGSRRTSMYSYTPSVGMSRRQSLTGSISGSGMHTPTGPPPPYQMGMQKPVVRMPIPAPIVPALYNAEVFLGDNAAIVHSPPATLPMHQPVPQKTVSVADIESPTRAPQQQSQQPFHQQVPHASDQSQMPNIPEGAIYAQPFQPYPMMQPGFYGYPEMMAPQQMAYVGGPVMPMQQPSSGSQDQQGAMPHETNGMVYYYDPSEQYAPPMMSMMQPPYFYPPMQNHMFYQ